MKWALMSRSVSVIIIICPLYESFPLAFWFVKCNSSKRPLLKNTIVCFDKKVILTFGLLHIHVYFILFRTFIKNHQTSRIHLIHTHKNDEKWLKWEVETFYVDSTFGYMNLRHFALEDLSRIKDYNYFFLFSLQYLLTDKCLCVLFTLFYLRHVLG